MNIMEKRQHEMTPKIKANIESFHEGLKKFGISTAWESYPKFNENDYTDWNSVHIEFAVEIGTNLHMPLIAFFTNGVLDFRVAPDFNDKSFPFPHFLKEFDEEMCVLISDTEESHYTASICVGQPGLSRYSLDYMTDPTIIWDKDNSVKFGAGLATYIAKFKEYLKEELTSAMDDLEGNW